MATEKPPDELAAKREAKPRKKRLPSNRVETHESMVLAKKKAGDALALKLAGANLQSIADQLGYAGPSGALYALRSAIKDLIPEATRQEYLELELLRLDRLQAAHWAPALNGNQKSAGVVQKCIDTRIRLLGLEAPKRLDVSVNDGVEIQIEVLQVLDEATLAAAMEIRARQHALAELRAGAIEVEAIEETTA